MRSLKSEIRKLTEVRNPKSKTPRLTGGLTFLSSCLAGGGGWADRNVRAPWLAAGLLLLATPFLASAQSGIPAAINYQGKLTDNLGRPVTNGYYEVWFRIWDHPTQSGDGNYFWGRSFPLHVVTNGMFNVLLTDAGSSVTTPSAPQVASLLQAFEGADRYLGLTISQKPGGPVTAPVEISPRQQLVSAPFTIHAYSASLAGTATLATNALSAQKVTGDATLSGGLTVAGTTTLSGPATFAGTTTLADSTILSGNMNILTNSSTTGGGFVPIGGILMWSGAIAPSGWALCDGTQVKGIQTPDLRGRFVLASGSGANLTPRALNAFGGKETHALGVSEMPSHSHPVSVHTVGYEAKYNNDNTEATAAPKTYKGQNNGSQDFPVSNQGGGAAHTNMPPYYVLAFIMRVQ